MRTCKSFLLIITLVNNPRVYNKTAVKIQQQLSITINFSKIYCIPGQNRKDCVLPRWKKYPYSPPSFLRFTHCEKFLFAPLHPGVNYRELTVGGIFRYLQILKFILPSMFILIKKCLVHQWKCWKTPNSLFGDKKLG